jgi:hypothetical protein
MSIDPTNNAAAAIPQNVLQAPSHDGDKDDKAIKSVTAQKPRNDGDKDDAVVNISAQSASTQNVVAAANAKIVSAPVAGQNTDAVKTKIDKIV